MRKKNSILVALSILLIGGLLASTSSYAKSVSVRKFRFGKHKKYDFERLVIQFSGAGVDPIVKIAPHPTKQEATVSLKNIVLTGAIPESAINDSYISRSRYLGPISINTDDPTKAAKLRVFLKENTLKFDAFWVQNPPRLVVDAFPPTAPRSSGGRHILKRKKRRKPASLGFNPGNVICFPASTQLSPTVTFTSIKGEPASKFLKENHNGPIVCFPMGAKVRASIHFAPSSRIPQSLRRGPVQLKGTAARPNLLPPPPRLPGNIPPRFNKNLAKPPALPPNLKPPANLPKFAPPRFPNSNGKGPKLQNTGGKGSRVNAGGFSPVTPLGSKLGATGPVAPKADPKKLFGK